MRVSSVARSCATKDANNKDNVWKPNIPAGIYCPPPSKTISPLTWFGTISTGRTVELLQFVKLSSTCSGRRKSCDQDTQYCRTSLHDFRLVSRGKTRLDRRQLKVMLVFAEKMFSFVPEGHLPLLPGKIIVVTGNVRDGGYSCWEEQSQ